MDLDQVIEKLEGDDRAGQVIVEVRSESVLAHGLPHAKSRPA
jgi:hypothetical protein